MSAKRFILKLAGFVIVAFFCQALIAMRVHIPEPVKSMLSFMRKPTDILYLGDSALFSRDTDRRDTTPDLLDRMLPDHSVRMVAYPGYTCRLYLAYCKYLYRHNVLPDTVVVPVNLRQFSPSWYANPMYQFPREKFILAYGHILYALFYEPLAVFKAVKPEISAASFERLPVFNGPFRAGYVRDFERIDWSAGSSELKRKRVIYDYLYALDPAHDELRALISLIELLAPTDTQLLLYVVPVDMETGNNLAGAKFRERIAENVDVVMEQLSKAHGVKVLDTHALLSSEDFNRELYMNSHMKYSGRSKLAAAIADALTL